MTTDWTTEAKGSGEYAEVNGIYLYYETHGAGRPMILLHGGLGSGEMFGPILPALAARHQVIAVDLQGHGRTADIDRPIDVRLMAEDIAALIDHLGLAESLVNPLQPAGVRESVISGSAPQIADAIRSFREVGFTQVDLMLGPGTVEAMDAMAPVVELLRSD